MDSQFRRHSRTDANGASDRPAPGVDEEVLAGAGGRLPRDSRTGGGTAPCLSMPAPPKRGGQLSRKNETSRRRFAFAAVNTENGAFVARLREDTPEVCPQKEHGRFETWTQAQGFAAILNQKYGLDGIEVQCIEVSAGLAAAKAGRNPSAGLPASVLAQFGDVRGVMPAVPGVEEQQPVHGAYAMFRVPKGARVFLRLQRAQ